MSLDKKVLIIDDSGMILRNIKMILEGSYTVCLAVSGKVGLTMLEKHKPDVILLDYEMPEMNGIETFAEIRKSPDGANVPIIFLSGVDDEETINNINKCNPAGFIMKPPGSAQLFEAIVKALG